MPESRGQIRRDGEQEILAMGKKVDSAEVNPVALIRGDLIKLGNI